jgi:hypothetical protein
MVRDEVVLAVKAEVVLPSHIGESVPDQDKAAIQKTLDRYADVYSKRKAKSLREIWPTVPAAKLNAVQSIIESAKNLYGQKSRCLDHQRHSSIFGLNYPNCHSPSESSWSRRQLERLSILELDTMFRIRL